LKPKGLFDVLSESQAGKTSIRSNHLMVAISIALAALFLYLALRNMDWHIFFTTIKNAQYVYLPIVFLWSSSSFLIRALRLRVLLVSEKPLPISNVFWANMAGYLGNNILPARAGELVRAAYLARKNNISASFALAVGLVERLIDLITLIVLGSLALSSTGIISPVFQSTLKGIAIIGLIGLAAIFILPRFSKLVEYSIMSIPKLKEVYKLKLNDFLQQFLNGLTSLHSIKRAILFVGLTGLIWLTDALGTVILSYILNIPLLLRQAFVLIAALGLSSAIPSTPGYVGVYQFVAVTILTPFGISQSNALAFILIAQILGYLNIGCWGLASMWQFNKHMQT
jgi:uncharacterized protein (TIRG00374 family)